MTSLPDDVARIIIGESTVIVDGVDKPAVYFENADIAVAESLGGEMLVTP
jgi:hypothetical protein